MNERQELFIFIDKRYSELEKYINNLTDNEEYLKLYTDSYKKNSPRLYSGRPTLKVLLDVKTDVENLTRKIIQPVVQAEKSSNNKDTVYYNDKDDIKQPVKKEKVIPTVIQRDALISTGEINIEDIERYGIIGDYSDYGEWWNDEDNLNFVAEMEASYHKFFKDTYTPSQLAKTYNSIAESFIIQDCDKCDSDAVLKYLKFIKQKPEFALPSLLWIDTFHDFKEERLIKGKVDYKTSKKDLNKIIDYMCYRIYGRHWGNLNKGEALEDCVNIGHQYNFDKMYQNSFFIFDNDVNVMGFHPDVIHTVLKPLFKDKEAPLILYNVSNSFISKIGGWENEFLYAYLMYNFNFDLTKEGLMDNLRDVFWNEIKGYKDDEYSIPYYAKDVDKGSSNFFKGVNVILPASLFDANRSNSSSNPLDFVPIQKTIIPCANGYNFVYDYNDKDCMFRLGYSNTDKKMVLMDHSYPICNKKEVEKRQKNNPKVIEWLTIYETDKNNLKALDKKIDEISTSISSEDLYDKKHDIKKLLDEVFKLVKTIYFNNSVVRIPNRNGISPIDVVSVVIGLLYNKSYIQDHPLSPISCKYLDFWVSLKRIGDFGQVLQCKQLGIPLFTNDNMQLLISMASNSSAVWTSDNAKTLWYDSVQDSILCNGLNPDKNRVTCNKQRFQSKGYTDIVNSQLLFDRDNLINKDVVKNMLDTTSNNIEKEEDEDLKEIRNIRNGCSFEADLKTVK